MSVSLFFCRFFRCRTYSHPRERAIRIPEIGTQLVAYYRQEDRLVIRSDPLRYAPFRSAPRAALMIEEVVDVGDYARSNE